MVDIDYKQYYGFHRARVVDPHPSELWKYGAVRVFIPDFMSTLVSGHTLVGSNSSESESIDEHKNGLIAYPANNPIGGRNNEGNDQDSHGQGCVYIPPKNSYVWVFFEGGNLEKPYYFSAFDSRNAELPPEQTLVNDSHKVYTILRTHQGRTICVSDDEDSQRIEITGKKRQLDSSNPSGDSSSTYTIDGNMTTILLDERSGKEKLLIRTYNGDFLHIDIDQRKLQAKFENGIIFETNGKFSIKADSIHMNSDGDTKITGESVHIYSRWEGYVTAGRDLELHGRLCTNANICSDKSSDSGSKSSPDSAVGNRDT